VLPRTLKAIVHPRLQSDRLMRPLNLTVRPRMTKWRYTLSLSFLMSLSGCIEITTYVSPSASGTVVDAATKKPVQGATISVDDHPGLFAQTNSDGQFSLAPTTRTTHIFWLAPYRSLPPGGTVVRPNNRCGGSVRRGLLGDGPTLLCGPSTSPLGGDRSSYPCLP
jgi:hypothetical protein